VVDLIDPPLPMSHGLTFRVVEPVVDIVDLLAEQAVARGRRDT
jgi:hypothetical protein